MSSQEELERLVNELRVELANTRGHVGDLMRWREVFEDDIKDSLKAIKVQQDIEMREVTSYLRSIERQVQDNNKNIQIQMQENNKDIQLQIQENNKDVQKQVETIANESIKAIREAGSKLPLWGSLLISAILVIGGWGIEIALKVH